MGTFAQTSRGPCAYTMYVNLLMGSFMGRLCVCVGFFSVLWVEKWRRSASVFCGSNGCYFLWIKVISGQVDCWSISWVFLWFMGDHLLNQRLSTEDFRFQAKPCKWTKYKVEQTSVSWSRQLMYTLGLSRTDCLFPTIFVRHMERLILANPPTIDELPPLYGPNIFAFFSMFYIFFVSFYFNSNYSCLVYVCYW